MGAPGRRAGTALVPLLRRRHGIQVVVANGDWGSDRSHTGMAVREAEKFLIENNIIDVGYPHPLGFTKAVAPAYFNNTNSAGTLVPGYDEVAAQNASEIQTVLDDLLCL